MPTDRTITPEEAGVFLPGMTLLDKSTGRRVFVIVPDDDAMQECPDRERNIFVRHDGREFWIDTSRLRYLTYSER